MRLQVEVPDAVFAKLATLAEHKQVRISELIAEPLAEAIKVTLGMRVAGRSRPWVRVTPQMQDRIVEMADRNMSWIEIARELRISMESARRWGIKLGVRTRRQEVQARNAAQRAGEEQAA